MAHSTNRITFAGVDGSDRAHRRLPKNEHEVLRTSGTPAAADLQARGTLHRAQAEMTLYRRLVL